MVGKVDYSSVPASADLENNSNQKKYTVNQTNKKGLVISKPLCALMAIGAFLLALLVGLIVFFLVPRYCNGEKPPEALTHTNSHISHTNSHISHTNSQLSNSADTNKTDGAEEMSGDYGEMTKGDGGEEIKDDGVDERLPRSLEPEHYKIRILPDLHNITTNGTVMMTLKAVQNTNEIIFHLRDIEILEDSVSVKSTKSDSSPLEISSQDYLPGDKYKISLKDSLQANEKYELHLEFNGVLNQHLQGFYRGSYKEVKDGKDQERIFASTQFSPVDARKAFPCFDEPSFKAKFEITLGRPSHMSTLSNMPLLKSTPFTKTTERVKRGSKSRKTKRNNNDNAISDLWYWDEYPETPIMSTYLVAFMVHEFKNKSGSDPLMKFWARKELISQTQYASEITPKILHFFEKYFDINFPLKKIDLVAVPNFGFSGMENWGLITFRENSLLYDPYSSTTSDKRYAAGTMAHEIAHQWFGNLVTPKFWNDLWLKEGFSDYMMFLGLNHAEPKWKVMEEFTLTTAAAMNVDSLETSRKLSYDEAKNSPQIRELFDPISYSKGAVIVRMMNKFLGEKTFKDGLIRYLKKYQYSNADRKDLFAILTEEAQKNEVLKPDESVTTIMNSWTDKAGYPVITATANYEKQKLTISQKRFYFKEKDEKSSWWVPLSFTTNATNNSPNFTDTLPKFWLKGEYEMEEDVNLTNYDWYLLNMEQTGYFIVNYDDRNWEKLSENIMNFPPSIRAQLIGDSMDLARANLLDYDIPLTLIANMAIQDNQIMYIPTLVAFSKLKFLRNMLFDTPAFGLFEEFQQNIFQDTYKRVTLDVLPNEDYISTKIRATVLEWSCFNPDSRCTHRAKIAFREWLTRGTKIDPDLRSIVYCTAIREGSDTEWDFAYQKYLETSSVAEQNTIIDALGCTRQRWLLSRYLENFMHNSMKIEDAPRLFGGVVRNEVGTQIAFDFLRKRWNEIIERSGDGFNIVSKMVKSLGVHLTTKFQLLELIRFHDDIKSNLTSAAGAFKEAIENVKQTVEWKEKLSPKVEQWLQNNRDLRSRIREKQRLERYEHMSHSPARGA